MEFNADGERTSEGHSIVQNRTEQNRTNQRSAATSTVHPHINDLFRAMGDRSAVTLGVISNSSSAILRNPGRGRKTFFAIWYSILDVLGALGVLQGVYSIYSIYSISAPVSLHRHHRMQLLTLGIVQFVDPNVGEVHLPFLPTSRRMLQKVRGEQDSYTRDTPTDGL